MIVSRLAHVALTVSDLEASTDFYGELFGMTSVGESPTARYLACGSSNTFELGLREGEPAFDHLALAVVSAEAIDLARDRLADAGVPVTDVDVDHEPGLERAIQFNLPAGHVVRLALESHPRAYTVRADVGAAHRRGAGPVALEHITLLCPDIAETATFLVNRLGLRISDSVQPPSQPWRNTHLRAGVLHHDIGLLPDSVPALHHIAFAVASTAELVATGDALAQRGIPLDASMGRHVAGNNVFVYFRDPSGHRLEVNTDMARVDAAAPAKIVTAPLPFDAWRRDRPPALLGGTPLQRGAIGARS